MSPHFCTEREWDHPRTNFLHGQSFIIVKFVIHCCLTLHSSFYSSFFLLHYHRLALLQHYLEMYQAAFLPGHSSSPCTVPSFLLLTQLGPVCSTVSALNRPQCSSSCRPTPQLLLCHIHWPSKSTAFIVVIKRKRVNSWTYPFSPHVSFPFTRYVIIESPVARP